MENGRKRPKNDKICFCLKPLQWLLPENFRRRQILHERAKSALGLKFLELIEQNLTICDINTNILPFTVNKHAIILSILFKLKYIAHKNVTNHKVLILLRTWPVYNIICKLNITRPHTSASASSSLWTSETLKLTCDYNTYFLCSFLKFTF